MLNCVRPSAAPLDAAENRQTVRSQLVRRARRFIEAARNLTATTFMNLLFGVAFCQHRTVHFTAQREKYLRGIVDPAQTPAIP